jgi:hypothetical protein
LILVVQVAFESIYVSGPEPAERSPPGIHLLKWFSFQPVETPPFKPRPSAPIGLLSC